MGAGTFSASPSVDRMACSIRAMGTEVAASKMLHSLSMFARIYALSGSTLACCSLLSTSTAERATISGHSALSSANDSGLAA